MSVFHLGVHFVPVKILGWKIKIENLIFDLNYIKFASDMTFYDVVRNKEAENTAAYYVNIM